MSRFTRLFICLIPLALVVVVWLPRSASAKTVTGIELGVEGGAMAMCGQPFHLFFTLYEIWGRNALRPAQTGTLHISTTLPDHSTTKLHVDKQGRATLALKVPEDESRFNVVVEASLGKFSRQFSLPIDAVSLKRIELVSDRTDIQPGETVTFLGRAVNTAFGHPLSERTATLVITDQDDRRIVADEKVTTTAAGTFQSTIVAPKEATSIKCTVSVDDISPVSVTVQVAAAVKPRMMAFARPRKPIVRPGEKVVVDVTVRRSDGRPIAGAIITGGDDISPTKENEKIVTDNSGRAQLVWITPRSGAEDIQDRTTPIQIDRAGLGNITTTISVRTARKPFQVQVFVEGGALLPNLPSRLWVKASSADGMPASNVRVEIDNPLLGTLRGRTDMDGVAQLDGRPTLRAGIESMDRCGGMTASAVTTRLFADDSADTASVYESCVPVDPDGAVRVRPKRIAVAPKERITVDMLINKSAAAYPVELALLYVGYASDESEPYLIPLSRQVVETGGKRRKATLQMPGNISGEFVVRARPLVGPSRRPSRGGTARLFSVLGEPATASIEVNNDRKATLSVSGEDKRVSTVLLVPTHEARGLMSRFADAVWGPVESGIYRMASSHSNLHRPLLEAVAASHARRDDAAPSVLRRGVAVDMPAAEYPPRWGILRDPLRARSRFVRGRLALAVKTLEERLDKAAPSHIRNIGMLGPGGHRFNREALTAVLESGYLEDRTPRTLGGEPLTLTDLEQMDRSFTFDNMARRITRKRLFALLVHLRRFVRERNLDLVVKGQDPTLWLKALFSNSESLDEMSPDGLDESPYNESDIPDIRLLYDGWGRRMAVLRVHQPTSQSRFLDPLPTGYRLVSAGPDGRFHTRDDLTDPFARVLASGSIYAEAVGEDALVLRLNRIENDRATVDALIDLFDEAHSEYDLDFSAIEAEETGTSVLSLVPLEPISQDTFERRFVSIERSRPSTIDRNRATIPMSVDDEPRHWSLIAASFDENGRMAMARHDFTDGFPLILNVPPIRLLTPNEPLVVPVTGTTVPGGPAALELEVVSKGAVHAEWENGRDQTPLEIGPGGGFEARLRIHATNEGEGSVHIIAKRPKVTRTMEVTRKMRVQPSGLLRRSHASSGIAVPTTLRLNIPDDAAGPSGTCVLTAPDTILGDPSLKPWIKKDPALIAWALSILGRSPSGRLLRQLEAATQTDGATQGVNSQLSTACAAAAWFSVVDTHTRFSDASKRAVSRSESDDERTRLAEDAAVLAAMSVAASPKRTTILTHIRNDLREVVRKYRGDPALLARAAAALLLVDRRDLRGRAMLALASQHLGNSFRDGKVLIVPASTDPKTKKLPNRAGEAQIIGTAALAIAAHQAGDKKLTESLARGLASEAGTAAKLGGDALFWFIAARAFGVFGLLDSANLPSYTVAANGTTRTMELGRDPISLPMGSLGKGENVVIQIVPNRDRSIIPLVYLESTYMRPATRMDNGPLNATLKGDAGFVGERAAYTATVSNDGNLTIRRPVILLSLPSGAELDDDALWAIERLREVKSVHPATRQGIVRIRMNPISAHQKVTIPIPLRWIAGGHQTGAALALFPEDRDTEITIVPPLEVSVSFRKKDVQSDY